MTTSIDTPAATYDFLVGQISYTGTAPSTPGHFSVGTSDIAAWLYRDGLLSFAGAGTTEEDAAVNGSIYTEGGPLELSNLGSMQVFDYAPSGTELLAVNNIAGLTIQANAADAVNARIDNTNFVNVADAGSFHARIGAIHGTFNLFDTPNASVISEPSADGVSSLQADVSMQPGSSESLTATNLGALIVVPGFGTTTGSLTLHAANLYTLTFGSAPDLKNALYASNVRSITLYGVTNLTYGDVQAGDNTLISQDNSLITGNFALHGGEELVYLTQGNGSATGTAALNFDLTHSANVGNGINVYLEEGNVTTASGEDAIFHLGAATTSITVGVNGNAYQTGRTGFIGGTGTISITGDKFGTDVVFGTGPDFVTGGAGTNTYSFLASVYAGHTGTTDWITDFKVAIDVLSLSQSVESSTTINTAYDGEQVDFGSHAITLTGVHNFTLSDIHWVR